MLVAIIALLLGLKLEAQTPPTYVDAVTIRSSSCTFTHYDVTTDPEKVASIPWDQRIPADERQRMEEELRLMRKAQENIWQRNMIAWGPITGEADARLIAKYIGNDGRVVYCIYEVKVCLKQRGEIWSFPNMNSSTFCILPQ